MGEADRYQDYKRQAGQRKFAMLRPDNAVMALFTLNAVGYLLLLFLQVSFFFAGKTTEDFQQQVMQYMQLPGNIRLFSERPWTILSFMFSEQTNQIIRMLSNMFWLWTFGYILQSMAGNNKVIPIYIYGGITGAIFFLTAGSFLDLASYTPAATTMVGANASVMAIAFATTTLNPRFRLFSHIRNGVPIWVISSLYLIIDLAATPPNHAIAHLGGAFAGFAFITIHRKGIDPGAWMNRLYDKLTDWFTPGNSNGKLKEKATLFYEHGGRSPFSKKQNLSQQRVDEILDKINQKGYHFLTEEEKQILKKASEEDLG